MSKNLNILYYKIKLVEQSIILNTYFQKASISHIE